MVEVADLPGRIVARLARLLETALVSVELTLPQYRTLMFLEDGAVPASALADKLAVTPPSVTTVVDGLVARGLVERSHDAADRRRVGHALTMEGRRVLASADEAVDRRLGHVAEYLDTEARAAAYHGLASWRVGLDATREAMKEAKKGASR